MQDTTKEILQKQREIIFGKSPKERFMIGVGMINFGRIIVESSIREKDPDISAIDLKIAVFRRTYANDFPSEELEKITKAFEQYYLSHQKAE
jgi:hypothetical protein